MLVACPRCLGSFEPVGHFLLKAVGCFVLAEGAEGFNAAGVGRGFKLDQFAVGHVAKRHAGVSGLAVLAESLRRNQHDKLIMKFLSADNGADLKAVDGAAVAKLYAVGCCGVARGEDSVVSLFGGEVNLPHVDGAGGAVFQVKQPSDGALGKVKAGGCCSLFEVFDAPAGGFEAGEVCVREAGHVVLLVAPLK